MGKSILMGVLSGTIVSAMFLGGVSLMLPPPTPAATPEAANNNAAADVAAAPEVADAAPSASQAEATPTDVAPAAPTPTEVAPAEVAPTEVASAEGTSAGAEPVVPNAPEASVAPKIAPEPSPSGTDAAATADAATAPDQTAQMSESVTPEYTAPEKTAPQNTAPETVAPDAVTDAATMPPAAVVVDAPAAPVATPTPETVTRLPSADAPAPAASLPVAPSPDVPEAAVAPDVAAVDNVPVQVAPGADTAPAAPSPPEAGANLPERIAPSPAGPAEAQTPAIAPAEPAGEKAPGTEVTASAAPPVAEAGQAEAPAASAPAPAAEAPPAQLPQIVPGEQPQTEPQAEGLTPKIVLVPSPGEEKVATGRKNLPPVISFDTPKPPQGVAEAPKPGFRNVPGVKVNRLPTIGSVVADAGQPGDDTTAASSDVGDLPAIRKYAAPFGNPDNLPLMSIVLIDLGEAGGGLDMASLRTLGFPLTVALDPTRQDATARAAQFRDAGFEVVILDRAPAQGATPADMEVAYQGAHAALPEAVAVMSPPDGGFQNTRQGAQHMVALAKPDGLGIVSWNEGLNSVPQLAGDISLPHAEIWREVDGGGARSEAIRRGLDRAAFEAQQKGQIVVALTSLPESVTALFAWAAEGRKGVALAPVSAVALRTVGQ